MWRSLVTLGSELRHLGPALLLHGGKEGVTGSVHWRLTPKDEKGCAWLIAVNANEKVMANVTIPIDATMTTQAFFGNGMITEEGANALITLPPMGTLAACCSEK
jgi:hypothetical protein